MLEEKWTTTTTSLDSSPFFHMTQFPTRQSSGIFFKFCPPAVSLNPTRFCDTLSRSFPFFPTWFPYLHLGTQMLKGNFMRKRFLAKRQSYTQVLENFSTPIDMWFDVTRYGKEGNDKTCSSYDSLTSLTGNDRACVPWHFASPFPDFYEDEFGLCWNRAVRRGEGWKYFFSIFRRQQHSYEH